MIRFSIQDYTITHDQQRNIVNAFRLKLLAALFTIVHQERLQFVELGQASKSIRA